MGLAPLRTDVATGEQRVVKPPRKSIRLGATPARNAARLLRQRRNPTGRSTVAVSSRSCGEQVGLARSGAMRAQVVTIDVQCVGLVIRHDDERPHFASGTRRRTRSSRRRRCAGGLQDAFDVSHAQAGHAQQFAFGAVLRSTGKSSRWRRAHASFGSTSRSRMRRSAARSRRRRSRRTASANPPGRAGARGRAAARAAAALVGVGIGLNAE